ncbi:signal peptidase II [Dethiothermospora halolimnae]|uniref:signal peptidase II n=1 Tax=Dethiothermospora halolimnae TaxID=3114390 RepID=UPI003CCB740E
MEIIYYVLFIFMITSIDQFTKKAICHYMKKNDLVFIKKRFIKIVIARNYGAAFGILKNKRLFLKIINGITIIMISILIFVFNEYVEYKMFVLPLILMLGGALGNYIDRIRLGYVVDFIRFNFKRCPIFNLGDIFIFTGSITLVIFYYFL